MTAEAAAPQDGRFTRGRRSFRRWRKSRPFWGGFFLLLRGLELLYSGNLSLGNIQIHLGLIGFYSYIIPLVVILCGALTWTLPSQRLFYGIVGNAAVVYSIVSVNLGGFLIGLLLGIVGGALSIAWVPDKRRFGRGAQPIQAGPDNDVADGVGPDDAGDGLPTETDVTDPNDFFARPTDADATTAAGGASVPTQEQQRGPEQNVEGEQRHPFRVRRHAVADSQRTTGGRGHRDGQTLAIVIVAITLTGSAAVAARSALPAAANTCTPTPLQSAIARAVGSSANNKRSGAAGNLASHKAGVPTRASSPAAGTRGTPTGGLGGGSANGTGSAATAPGTPNGEKPKPVASVVGGVLGLLGGVLPAATGLATGPPSDPPTDPPTDPPSAPPTESPAPSPAPTSNPTPTEPPTPLPTRTIKPKPTPIATG